MAVGHILRKRGLAAMRKVAKFGGSSLADAKGFARVRDIVLADGAIALVVVSAPGRRFSGDSKVTDLLYLCDAHRQYGHACDDLFAQIEARFCDIAAECGIDEAVYSEDLAQIKTRLQQGAVSRDWLVSRGEYLTGKLLARYLGFTFLDARAGLYFDVSGRLDLERSYSAIAAAAAEHGRLVLPGFYGVQQNGKIKSLSRGGSDVTGAVAAAALHADVYENWTDVPGMLMADPTIVQNPRPIDCITYNELREMAFMGARVLHEEAIFPVRERGIPIHILNTHDPAASGTRIQEDFFKHDAQTPHTITGIAGQGDFSVVSVRKHYTDSQADVMRNVLGVLADFSVSVEHMSAGVDNLSLAVKGDALRDCMVDVLEKIRVSCHPESVQVHEDIALLAVVGRNLAKIPDIAGRVCTVLAQRGVDVHTVSQEYGDSCLIVGVANKSYADAMRALYDGLVS